MCPPSQPFGPSAVRVVPGKCRETTSSRRPEPPKVGIDTWVGLRARDCLKARLVEVYLAENETPDSEDVR
jgi:hypothetical protein